MGRRALVLEDNRSSLFLLTQTLESGGWTVESAQTLAEALARPQANIIVADLNVPDSEGLDTVIRLRARSEPIIVLTGVGDDQHAADAIRAGATDYLVKGEYSPGQLLRACRHAVERARKQDELKRAHAELQAVISATPDGLLLVDSAGVIRMANVAARRMLGRDVGDAFRAREGIWETLRAGSSLNFTGTPVTWEGASATLVSVREPTLQRQSEAQAVTRERRLERAHALKALGRMCATLAQQYDGGLRSLDSGLRALNAEDPRLVEAIDPMFVTLTQLRELNRTVRAFSGQHHPERGTVTVDELLRAARPELQEVLGEDLVLVLDLNARGRWVALPDGDLRSCMLRLVENAATASVRGEVVIRTTVRSSVVWVEVVDQGVGMEPDILSRALEPFYTTDSARDGLGLSAVEGLVRSVGGVVELQSLVSVGTTARLVLPSSAEKMVDVANSGDPPVVLSEPGGR